MKKILSFILLLVVATTFINCGGDDDKATSSMTVTIDGIKSKIKAPSGILTFLETPYDHEGRNLMITGQVNGNPLTVSVRNWDFQNPPKNGILAKDYFNIFQVPNFENSECVNVNENIVLCEGGLITYTVGNEIFFSAFDEEVDAFITITKCSDKKISGEFKVKLVSPQDNELDISGTFSDVSYIVEK